MQRMKISVYVNELLQQARFARLGVLLLNEGLKAPAVVDVEGSLRDFDVERHRMESQERSDKALAGVQTLLTAAAQISKLLWAVLNPEWAEDRREFAISRAKRLRQIAKPKSILQSRAIRNSIEHMDERLDSFMASETNEALLEFIIAPTGAVTSEVGMTTLRYLYTDRLTFQALDDEVSLQELTDAIIDVEKNAAAWLDAPGNRFL